MPNIFHTLYMRQRRALLVLYEYFFSSPDQRVRFRGFKDWKVKKKPYRDDEVRWTDGQLQTSIAPARVRRLSGGKGGRCPTSCARTRLK